MTPIEPLRSAISALHLQDDAAVFERLLPLARPTSEETRQAEPFARALVAAMRAARATAPGIDAFLHAYSLDSAEGVVLMCLAEALLRVPDAATADRLIEDKLSRGQWDAQLGRSDSALVNAATWGLMLTGKVVSLNDNIKTNPFALLNKLIKSSGEPVIRAAMKQAMRIMGRQFVLGRDIAEALSRSAERRAIGYRHSFDMLGESAWTKADADRYYNAYEAALRAVAKHAASGPMEGRDSISVKLSALHPRYEPFKRARVMAEMAPRLEALAKLARDMGVALTVDAEESERLELSFDVIQAVGSVLRGYDGFGLALQSYSKRALPAIDYLAALAAEQGRRIPLRLVKGAYWDSEVKRAQEQGLAGYPVFTRKVVTDVSYLACARRILNSGPVFLPQFATHNAHSLSAVRAMAGDRRDIEFQRLHGMGQSLYDPLVEQGLVACRIYAPVGGHEDLLAYLVRRLLENGANSSFVNRAAQDEAPIAAIVADPVREAEALANKAHPRIPLPRDLFGAERRNSPGLALAERHVAEPLLAEIRAAAHDAPLPPVAGDPEIAHAFAAARAAFPAWNDLRGAARAAILDKAAEAVEKARPRLLHLLIREAGKTLPDAMGEWREAVDFLRFYAARAREEFETPTALPGPTGERNSIALEGRGLFVCISPWNFPLAIFLGQIVAALAAGNCVIAKPAEQTPRIAVEAVALLHQAGVPKDALHLLCGDGAVGAKLVAHRDTDGVAFTGSTEVARHINRALAARDGAIPVLIAETGGLNALIADSTALPEQVCRDALRSAFNSAGQRCSAARLLLVQDELYPRLIPMIAGAMTELKLGDPMQLDTDIGPVIDEEAHRALAAHVSMLSASPWAKKLGQTPRPKDLPAGHFFAPELWEIDRPERMPREVFGPILHVVRFASESMDQAIDALNGLGYGLTCGIHSRIDATAERVARRVRAGNLYVNRNMIGAVVGVQPFGGMGLSGTGPKAGGPHTLHRFATEKTVSVDTTAAGGNASLLSLDE